MLKILSSQLFRELVGINKKLEMVKNVCILLMGLALVFAIAFGFSQKKDADVQRILAKEKAQMAEKALANIAQKEKEIEKQKQIAIAKHLRVVILEDFLAKKGIDFKDINP